MSSLFDEKKASHVAAFFLFKANQKRGNLTVLKLMKLMYLAERTSYARFGEPIIGDRLVSMPHGPVLSQTLDLINNGPQTQITGGWDDWIAERSGRDLVLKDPSTIRTPKENLDQLSDSDLDVLECVWGEFGSWSAKKLEAFTHDPKNCPEWEDPDGSSIPIRMEILLSALQFSKDEASSLILKIQQRAWVATLVN